MAIKGLRYPLLNRNEKIALSNNNKLLKTISAIPKIANGFYTKEST